MCKTFKKLFLIFLILSCQNALAETLTVEGVVSLVKAAHPAVMKAKWEAEAARQGKNASLWLADPEAMISFEEIAGETSLGNADMTNYSLSQEIPFPTKLFTKTKMLSHELKAKKNYLTSAEREVEFEAKKTYYELVATQKTLKAKSTANDHYKILAVSLSSEYETGGTMNQTSSMAAPSLASDIFMVKMKKAENETEIHDLQHRREALLAKLNLMMGRDPLAPIETVPPKTEHLKLDVETLKQKLLTQNTDLKAMALLVKKSRAGTTLAKQNYIPNLRPELMYNQRQNRDNAYTLGLSFNLPLWAIRNHAEIKEAKAQEKRAHAEYNVQKLEAEEALHDLYNHAKWHAEALKKFQAEVLPLARSAVNTGLTDYQLNLSDTQNVLQKIINDQEANALYWQVWGDYMTEYAFLEKLIGEDI